MIDAATGIVRILKQEGVEWVSTFPVCKVNNALGREGLPMVMMRDDRYAVAVADAYSRITGKVGVCTVQGGVNAAGLQVAYAGLAQAFEDNSPTLCITDGVPIGGSENSHFDLTASLKSVSKWYGYIDKPERVPEFMRRAFTMLRTGRPGPVILALPSAEEFDETVHTYAPVKGWKFGPDPADVAPAVELIQKAKNPLIYAGEGVIYSGASEELKAFAELANIPVVTTLKAKGAFPEDHPLFVGVRGDHVVDYLTKSDLILAVGSSLSPGRFSHGMPDVGNKTIINLNISELDVNKVYPTAHALIGDAKFSLQALTDALTAGTSGGGIPRDSVAAEIKASRDEGLKPYRDAMASDDTPINPYRVYSELMNVLDPRKSFVTHESGNTRDQLSTVYDTLIPRGFLGWGNISSLGFSLGAVVAAKLAHPDRYAVAVTGEAGLGYMLGNLEVPVRQKLPVTIIHISNGGFSGYGPGFWGVGHDPYTHVVMGHDQVNMPKAIAEFGYYTERIESPGEVRGALERALAANDKGQSVYMEFICSQFPVYGKWAAGGYH
jgi:thiamine pyrophosphate-dependent acetolactate synthase large subunit-like protein